MGTDQLEYSRLQGSSSVRFLRVEGLSRFFAGPDKPLRTELFEGSIDNPPAYEAISYTWDQQRADQPLTCNGKTLWVTPNAISALKAARLRGQDRVVWIDSICIDQSSVAEKNIQVPIMGRIYKKAARALIWLGHGTFATDVAFDFLADLVRISSLPLPEDERNRRMEERNSQFEAIVKQDRRIAIVSPAVSFVGDLLMKPWFRRMWTVQELVVAKDGQIMCGQKGMSWYRFLDGLGALQKLEELAAVRRNGPTSFKGVWVNGGALYQETDIYRRLRGMVRNATEIRSMPGEQPICCMILKSPWRRVSTEPRDKVYGVYGILEEMGIRDLPCVDYTKPVSVVYTEITRACIGLDRSLRLLYEISAFPKTEKLPFWVLD